MELNREQIRYKMSEKHIIRALECLSKPNSSPADREKCYFMWKEPSCFSCYHEVAQNALALIKELTEENERLRNRITATVILTDKDAEKIKNECLERIELDIKAIKADTVRKMQEMLIVEFRKDDRMNYYIRKVLDQIAKEMVEGK